MNNGMGLYLAAGWLLIGGYLIALLILSGVLVVFEYVLGRFMPRKALALQEVDPS